MRVGGASLRYAQKRLASCHDRLEKLTFASLFASGSLPNPVCDDDLPEGGPSLDRIYSAAYEELRRLARTARHGDPSETLNPTALVNEAYLKLVASEGFQPASRQHVKRVAARAMREVLVEAARRRTALKRGGGQRLVAYDEGAVASPATAADVLALHEALDALARMHPRQAETVECRFFGGFDIPETADVLDVSEATVSRDWRAAKAWLAREIRRLR